MFESIAYVYYKLIKKGMKTIDEIPSEIKKEVEQLLLNDKDN